MLSKQLVTVDSAVPLEVDWKDLAVKPPDRTALIPLLRELEFTGLIKDYLPDDDGPQIEVIETNDLPAHQGKIAFSVDDGRISLWTGSGSVASVPADSPGIAALLADPAVRKVTHDLKTTLLSLKRHGLQLAPPYEDVMLLTYLMFPNRGKYELADVIFELFGQTLSGNRTPWIEKLLEHLRQTEDVQTERVYRDIEMPLASVLFEMEQCGIAIDTTILDQMSAEMLVQMEDLTRRINALAGCEFNLNSPRQLGEVLFDKLNLPRPRKLRKSGQYSTAVEVLEELAETYELPKLVLEYRQLAKFKSTYVDVIPHLIDPQTRRLHTSFNQAGAATGRLSSSNPNLQNIPVRSELGRRIRGAFVAAPGCRFVAADYSQIELRIVAHLSGDERLAEAFRAGEDIHRRTAAEVLGLPIDAVSPEQRERAKAVNFGIVYGQTPFGLAQQLGISNDEAAEFISRYFERYRGVQTYIENCLSVARDSGVTRTLFGRLRQHPEINSRNGMRRSMAERTAINSPIQGTAADLIKLAMIRISKELKDRSLRTRMVLQVHDELIFEVPEDELEITSTIRDLMQGVAQLNVPLTVNVKQGVNWKDTK
jgi:DNA polymerase-1